MIPPFLFCTASFFYARSSSGKYTLLLPNGMIKYRDFILQGKRVASKSLGWSHDY